ncbi:MAG TPA: sulfite exporter TauE/SafE family protein [Thermomicrobiales bacterium]|nr:sulfite exporter TauE/SafE family protein [Thermomicrobiales bacterium]
MLASGSIFWLLLIGLGSTALGSMLGMAGGIFVVPLLVSFGDIELKTAIGASLVSVIACSCSGAPQFLRHRITNVRLATVLESATTIGAVTGVLLAPFAPVSLLYGLFGIVMTLSAYQMLRKRSVQLEDPDISAPSDPSLATRLLGNDVAMYRNPANRQVTAYRISNLPGELSFMYGAGVLSAMLGIGSGVLKIPAMDTALKLPLKVSSATSNFMIGVTGAASAVAYLLHGDIVPEVAGPVVLGSVLGTFIGSHLLLRIPGNQMRLIFAVILTALAIQMFARTIGIDLLGSL